VIYAQTKVCGYNFERVKRVSKVEQRIRKAEAGVEVLCSSKNEYPLA